MSNHLDWGVLHTGVVQVWGHCCRDDVTAEGAAGQDCLPGGGRVGGDGHVWGSGGEREQIHWMLIFQISSAIGQISDLPPAKGRGWGSYRSGGVGEGQEWLESDRSGGVGE